ncbi:hypothetical protein PNQ92_00160 [Halobacterium salinarum]|uniref:hypothetical protein n=1 Tax=Halobacterium salinarum TaxID=2242 RepID=UPI00255510C3|nr:hypothetical protein [Halobacterium salinarum]MDL0123822.1 hypothetical protein [Halobacterium salinarum]
MIESVPELFDLVTAPLLTIAGTTLVGGGLFAELQSATALAGDGGSMVFGLWLAVMGAVGVIGGAKVVRDAVTGQLS